MAVVVREAIDTAAKRQGWSRATLASRIGIGVATIHRWHAGTGVRYDAAVLAKLFRLAGLSMDDKLCVSEEAAADGSPRAGKLDLVLRGIQEIKAQLARLEPAAALLDALLGFAATMDRESVPDSDVLRARRAAASLRQESLESAQRKAETLGDKLAAATDADEAAAERQDERSA